MAKTQTAESTTPVEETTATKKISGDNFFVVIASRGGDIVLAQAMSNNKKVGFKTFASIAGVNDNNPARINALSILVDTLKKFKDVGIDGVVSIHTIDLVKNAIDEGYFKNWVDNGGKKRQGEISPEELELWCEFAELMLDENIAMHVAFKRIPSMRSQNNYANRNNRRNARPADPRYEFILKVCADTWEKTPEGGIQEVSGTDELPL